MSFEQRRSRTIAIKLTVIALAAAAIYAVSYFLVKDEVKSLGLRELPTATPAPAPAVVEPVKAEEKPVYEEPVAEPNPEPLPDLNQSDLAVVAALQGLGVDGLLQLVISEEILRKFVRAVDLVEEGKLATEYRPIVSPQGALLVDSFLVSVAGGELGEAQEVEQFRMSEKNYQRYDNYVRVLSLLDSEAVVRMYRYFYPLLNEAYKEMGSTKGNFHSVLIRAIDRLLAAPDATADMILVRPKVYYEFADPALEKLPAAQKLMLRMGPANQQRAKASLRNLRAKLLQK
ncbi:MAG TPA: DUF3014 domain-containing protein [Cellvibrio sp.]|nr:DUF3014 domain-containing protein [Cellvibrio sp.]